MYEEMKTKNAAVIIACHAFKLIFPYIIAGRYFVLKKLCQNIVSLKYYHQADLQAVIFLLCEVQLKLLICSTYVLFTQHKGDL